jgi:hypothetical protein
MSPPDQQLIARCVEACHKFEAAVIPANGSYEGVTAEDLLRRAGLTFHEQLRYMHAIILRMRKGRGPAPDCEEQGACRHCGRKFLSKGGVSNHEKICLDQQKSDRRIVASLKAGMTPGDVAKAFGIHWRTAYSAVERQRMRDRIERRTA